MKKQNKIGVEMSIAVLITITLLLVFLFIYGVFWKGAFGKSSGSLNNQISLSDDFDQDGIINFEDNCPCCTGCTNGASSLKGCPDNPTETQKLRTCPTKK